MNLLAQVAVGWGILCATQCASETPAIDWFQLAGLSQVRLSANGQWVGAITRKSGSAASWWVSNFVGGDSGSSPTLPGVTTVEDFAWTADEAAVLTGRNAAGEAQWWVVRPPEWTPSLLPMVLPVGRSIRLVHPQPRLTGTVLIEVYSRGAGGAWPDLFRMPLDGGPLQLVAKNPGDVGEWLADDSGRVRLALGIRGMTQELRIAPASPDGSWIPIFTFDFLRDPARLLALSADGQRGWLATRMGGNTRGVYEVELAARRISRARWTNPYFDWDGTLVVHGNELVAANFQADRPTTSWMNSEMATIWRATKISGQPQEFSSDGRRGLFFEIRDQMPGRWWWGDHIANSTQVVLPNEFLHGPEGQPISPVEWTASDGVVLRGYLTRPKRDNDAKPPLIVMAHGGPWARDVWEWRPEIQFLTDRGWAVLQVNYRGSAGLGWDFQRLGAGRWTVVANDLAEGARWVVAQGWADPNRQVVVGASFGGFLSAMSLTLPNQPFRAAASLGGVFDLPQWLRQARRRESSFIVAAQRQWLLGDQPAKRDAIRVPPEGIRHPLLLIHARDDDRVSIDQSVEFAEELRDLGIPFEYEWLPFGGHTFGAPEQQAQVWVRVEAFCRRAVGLPSH